MRALLAALVMFAVSSAPVAYRIDLKGGGVYWAPTRPTERSGRYVFRSTDGTLMSIRKSEVATIRQATVRSESEDVVIVGPTSPADAVRRQKVAAEGLQRERRAPNSMFRKDPYRPGVGLAYPPSSNDYAVGRTFAYPPSGTVYSGPAPTNVPEGPAPMLQTPPPPAPGTEPPPQPVTPAPAPDTEPPPPPPARMQ